MAYEILYNTVAGAGLRRALFETQAISYRLITMRSFRNEPININDYKNNRYYSKLKEIFNDELQADAVDEKMSYNDDFVKAVKSVVCTRGIRRIKRAKKQSSRVMREVKKMWNQGFYGKDKDIYDATILFHKAYRETFLNVRIRLKAELYDIIPDDLIVSLTTKREIVKNLYRFDDSRKAYVIDKDLISSKTDIRKIQLLIAPYVFDAIYRR